jgi:hypothetical protein
MRVRSSIVWITSALLALAACKGHVVALDRDASSGIDAGADAAPCIATASQCANCSDDDGDGKIDGFDPECTSLADNDEATFATGIAGDNGNTSRQDCFFDDNSGSGDDTCDLHVCCDLDVCPNGLPGPPYDPSECAAGVGATCIARCTLLVPPGCDCFGCCTICDRNGCADIYVHPLIAPGCNGDSIHDDTRCPACTKQPSCETPCGGDTCILCPGQNPDDLPASCAARACPQGKPPCAQSSECAGGGYCAEGCCLSL